MIHSSSFRFEFRYLDKIGLLTFCLVKQIKLVSLSNYYSLIRSNHIYIMISAARADDFNFKFTKYHLMKKYCYKL